MKLKAISKDIVRFLGYIFFLFSSLNSSLSFGNYFSDEVLKSVEKHTSDSQIQTNQAVTNGTATDQDGNTFAWKTFGDLDWALENAEVTHYNDGTEIPQEQEISSWSSQLIGSWCYVYGSTIPKIL
jgi:prophage antirepressor-like protein